MQSLSSPSKVRSAKWNQSPAGRPITSCIRRRRRKSRSWRLKRRTRARSWWTRRVRRRSESWAGREASGGTSRNYRTTKEPPPIGISKIWVKIRIPATGMPISTTFPPSPLLPSASLKLYPEQSCRVPWLYIKWELSSVTECRIKPVLSISLVDSFSRVCSTRAERGACDPIVWKCWRLWLAIVVQSGPHGLESGVEIHRKIQSGREITSVR